MTVTISPASFSTTGPLVLTRVESDGTHAASRRVSRTATLDGGVVLTDGGFTHGDRTLNLTHVAATEAEVALARTLCAGFATVTVATPEGLFGGALESVDYTQGDLTLTVLVTARHAEA